MTHEASLHVVKVTRSGTSLYPYVQENETISTLKDKILSVYKSFPGRKEIEHPEGLPLTKDLLELRYPEDVVLRDEQTIVDCELIVLESAHPLEVTLLYKLSNGDTEALAVYDGVLDIHSKEEIDALIAQHE